MVRGVSTSNRAASRRGGEETSHAAVSRAGRGARAAPLRQTPQGHPNYCLLVGPRPKQRLHHVEHHPHGAEDGADVGVDHTADPARHGALAAVHAAHLSPEAHGHEAREEEGEGVGSGDQGAKALAPPAGGVRLQRIQPGTVGWCNAKVCRALPDESEVAQRGQRLAPLRVSVRGVRACVCVNPKCVCVCEP